MTFSSGFGWLDGCICGKMGLLSWFSGDGSLQKEASFVTVGKDVTGAGFGIS